jgi:hypothetical protein
MDRDDEGGRGVAADGSGSPPGRAGGNVFLVTVDAERFERTVATPADLDEQPGRPEPLEGREAARLWGAPAGDRTRSTFERMAAGDLLIFYAEDRCVGVGEVGDSFEDGDGWVATTFWGGEPTPLVFTVENFRSVSVPRARVNAVFGYGAGYQPPVLMRVADDRVDSDPRAIALAVERVDRRQSGE